MESTGFASGLAGSIEGWCELEMCGWVDRLDWRLEAGELSVAAFTFKAVETVSVGFNQLPEETVGFDQFAPNVDHMAVNARHLGRDRSQRLDLVSQGSDLGSHSLECSGQMPKVFVTARLMFGHRTHKVFDSGKPFFGCHGFVHFRHGKRLYG